MKKIIKKSVCLPALLSLPTLAWASDEPTVTPYRPTVSNPAQLSQPGWLEMEAGLTHLKAGDNTRVDSLPYTLKLAFSENFGVLLGGDGYLVQTDTAGNRLSGKGDTQLLLKQRWGLDSGESALGLEYGFKAGTAKNGLGSGKTDYLVNGIYSTALQDDALDVNINLTHLGAVQPGEGRQQWGWAASWSHPLNESWSLAAEFSGVVRKATQPANQLLVAASYAMNRRVVWDVAFAKGISQAGPKWNLMGGVSILLGKI